MHQKKSKYENYYNPYQPVFSLGKIGSYLYLADKDYEKHHPLDKKYKTDCDKWRHIYLTFNPYKVLL